MVSSTRVKEYLASYGHGAELTINDAGIGQLKTREGAILVIYKSWDDFRRAVHSREAYIKSAKSRDVIMRFGKITREYKENFDTDHLADMLEEYAEELRTK